MIDLPPISKLWVPSKPAIIRASSLPKREDFRRGAFAPGFRAGGPSVLTYTDGVGSSTAMGTFTFSGVNIGPAFSGRYLVIAACGRRGGGNATAITDVSVDGTSASVLVTTAAPSGSQTHWLVGIPWPTGTTATIAVTFNSSSTSRCAVEVYALNGRSSSPSPFHTNSSSSNTASSRSISLNIPQNGCAVASYFLTATGNITWTGLTEDVDGLAGLGCSSAHDNKLSAQTGKTITAAGSTSTECTLVGASFA